MDISPYTLRELPDMVTARRREQQEQTAQICATILNARQGVKQHQLINHERLNPYRKKPQRKGGKMPITQFAAGWGK